MRAAHALFFSLSSGFESKKSERAFSFFSLFLVVLCSSSRPAVVVAAMGRRHRPPPPKLVPPRTLLLLLLVSALLSAMAGVSDANTDPLVRERRKREEREEIFIFFRALFLPSARQS